MVRATMWYNIRIVSLTNVSTLSAGNECKVLSESLSIYEKIV